MTGLLSLPWNRIYTALPESSSTPYNCEIVHKNSDYNNKFQLETIPYSKQVYAFHLDFPASRKKMFANVKTVYKGSTFHAT